MNRLLLSAALLALASRIATADDLFADPVLAKGTNVKVLRSQLDDAFIAYRATLASRGNDVAQTERSRVEAQILDRLIVEQLLNSLATEDDRAKARTSEKKFLAELGKVAESEADFRRYLMSIGVSGPQFTNRLVRQAIAEEVIGREVKSKIQISDEEVRKAYQTNLADFKVPEMAHVSHILILTRDPATGRPFSDDELKIKRATAEKALERARNGENFGKVAVEVSEDSRVKETKGDFKFTRAADDRRRSTIPEVENAAFGMRPGQISDIIVSQMGLHIVLLHEVQPARTLKLTDDLDGETVGSRIRATLTSRELQQRLPDFFTQLKKQAGVEILDTRLKEETDALMKSGFNSTVK